MRFCPFCSAENADELAVCQSCGRRLPPLPPRRARNAPPTGVQLPPRPAVTTQPPPLPMRRASATLAPEVTHTQIGPPIAVGPQSATHTQVGAPVEAGPQSATHTQVGAPIAAGPQSATHTQVGAPIAAGPQSATHTQVGAPIGAGPRSATHTQVGSPPIHTQVGPPPVVAAPFAPPGQPLPAGQPGPSGATSRPGPSTGRPTHVSPALLATTVGLAPIVSSGLRAPAPVAPATEPVPSLRETIPGVPVPPPLASDDARMLANVLSPGPAAQRREAAPVEPGDPAGNARRRSDTQSPPGPRPIPSVAGAPSRPAPTTNPPPVSTAPAALLPTAPPGTAPPAAEPAWASDYPRAPASYIDPDLQASALAVDASRRRAEQVEPPPTRTHRADALLDRPFTPPTVSQVPQVPEPGLLPSARYAVRFAQARWQRRGAIKLLGADIKKDTDALDQVLGALGGAARTAKLDGRVFSGENAAITTAEDHAAQMAREHNDVDTRKLEENGRFVEVERERNTKLGEAEHAVDEAQKELAQLEAQRRGLRDSRKELERRQKAYLKAAEDAEKQAGASEATEPRQDLRRSAEQHRREAAAIEPERQEADRGLAAIERPIAEASAKLDAAKAELDAAKRSLADAREGHTHRLAELDAEQKRKAREIAQAEAEIARRLVTLGTLVNLNRVDDPQFDELYQRIDRLRGAITARTTEIEKLTAEREAFDRGHMVRGVAVIGGAILLFIALIVILRALLVR